MLTDEHTLDEIGNHETLQTKRPEGSTCTDSTWYRNNRWRSDRRQMEDGLELKTPNDVVRGLGQIVEP
jgi:hypothetical protein